jgi:hypothetical protein
MQITRRQEGSASNTQARGNMRGKQTDTPSPSPWMFVTDCICSAVMRPVSSLSKHLNASPINSSSLRGGENVKLFVSTFCLNNGLICRQLDFTAFTRGGSKRKEEWGIKMARGDRGDHHYHHHHNYYHHYHHHTCVLGWCHWWASETPETPRPAYPPD